jgi:hypothetical protein
VTEIPLFQPSQHSVSPLAHFYLYIYIMSSSSLIEANIVKANLVSKLPFWSELDVELLLTTYREKFLPSGPDLTPSRLLQLFQGACTPLIPRLNCVVSAYFHL